MTEYKKSDGDMYDVDIEHPSEVEDTTSGDTGDENVSTYWHIVIATVGLPRSSNTA